jgi:hypothetical protein
MNMSSGRDIKKHHRTRIENCKGTLRGDRSEFGKWAYWCPERPKGSGGWYPTVCTCLLEEKKIQ